MLRDLHAGLAPFVVGANGFVGLWALGAHWLDGLRHRALWVTTAVAEIAIVVEVALGVGALNAGGREPDQFHLFYGFVAVATIGIIYSYRSQLEQYRYLLYGGGGLFLMGLALRAMQFSA